MSLTIVMAFTHPAQYTYTEAVFKLRFEDYANMPSFPSLDSADNVKKMTKGRFVAPLVFSFILLFLIVLTNVTSIAEYCCSIVIPYNLLNAGLFCTVLFFSCGYGVCFTLSGIHGRAPSPFEKTFMDTIPFFLIMSSLMLVFVVVFFAVATRCFCWRRYDFWYCYSQNRCLVSTFIVIFLLLGISCLSILAFLLFHEGKFDLHECDTSNKKAYFYYCTTENITANENKTTDTGSGTDVSPSATFLLPSATVGSTSAYSHTAAPIPGPVSAPIPVPVPIPVLVPVPVSVPVPAYVVGSAGAGEEVSADYCAGVARSVVRYTALVGPVPVWETMLGADGNMLCHDFTALAGEWMADAEKGAHRIRVASLWLGGFGIVPALLLPSVFLVVMCCSCCYERDHRYCGKTCYRCLTFKI